MKIPTVDQCCCGCSLRLGSAIIGVLMLIGHTSNLVTNAVGTENVDRASSITVAVLSAVMLVLAVFLLVGVHQERASYLLPWLVAYGVATCLQVITFLVVAIIGFVAYFVTGLIILFVGIIVTTISYYCFVVVYSYYLSLGEENKEGV